MKQWGILGGSFDPPHVGHVEIATLATMQLPLDGLYLVPCYDSLLSSHPPVAPAHHRLAMVSRVADGQADWEAVPYEVEQERAVATIETVAYLQQREPSSRPYLILGADQAAQFERWERWEQLADAVRLVCFARAGMSAAPAIANRIRMIAFDSPLTSTLVREKISRGEPVTDVLPPQVWEYIQAHGLYQ